MHTDDPRLITYMSKQPPVYCREIGDDEGEKGLVELYVDAHRHSIVLCLDDGGK
jgi:hypothetical protein